MLINLINNSIKALPNGGSITLRGWATQDGVAVSVSDTGVGMTPEALRRTLRGESGGLGLSIIQRLLKQNSGSLQIESTPGQGTLVTLSFHGTGDTNEI